MLLDACYHVEQSDFGAGAVWEHGAAGGEEDWLNFLFAPLCACGAFAH